MKKQRNIKIILFFAHNFVNVLIFLYITIDKVNKGNNMLDELSHKQRKVVSLSFSTHLLLR